MKQNEIEQLIDLYVQAVDAQNTNKAAEILCPDFRFVMKSNNNIDEVKILSRNEFLSLLEQKKVGGIKSTIHGSTTLFFGGNAVVLLSMENPKLKMNSIYTLIGSKERWNIISEQINIYYK